MEGGLDVYILKHKAAITVYKFRPIVSGIPKGQCVKVGSQSQLVSKCINSKHLLARERESISGRALTREHLAPRDQ